MGYKLRFCVFTFPPLPPNRIKMLLKTIDRGCRFRGTHWLDGLLKLWSTNFSLRAVIDHWGLAVIIAYGPQILDTKLLQSGFWVRVAIQKLEKSNIGTVDSGERIGLMVCLSLLKYQLLGKSCIWSLAAKFIGSHTFYPPPESTKDVAEINV